MIHKIVCCVPLQTCDTALFDVKRMHTCALSHITSIDPSSLAICSGQLHTKQRTFPDALVFGLSKTSCLLSSKMRTWHMQAWTLKFGLSVPCDFLQSNIYTRHSETCCFYTLHLCGYPNVMFAYKATHTLDALRQCTSPCLLVFGCLQHFWFCFSKQHKLLIH